MVKTTQEIYQQVRACLSKMEFTNGRMTETWVTAIAHTVVREFFVVPRGDIPVQPIDRENLSARRNLRMVFDSETVIENYTTVEAYYEDIIAAVGDYLVREELEDLYHQRDTETQEIRDLAFTLFKSASPDNIRYLDWNHLTREQQRVWTGVATKAKETLS